MPGGGIRLRSPVALERELQTELNQARGIGLTGDQTKRVSRRWSRESWSWESQLDPVEGVEELSPELQAKLVIGSELGPLEDRQIPVVDSGCAQSGIHTSFSAVSIVRGGVSKQAVLKASPILCDLARRR